VTSPQGAIPGSCRWIASGRVEKLSEGKTVCLINRFSTSRSAKPAIPATGTEPTQLESPDTVEIPDFGTAMSNECRRHRVVIQEGTQTVQFKQPMYFVK